MSFEEILIFFILGLAFGSFLNAVTLRYLPEDGFFARRNFRGRSFCLHCKKTLVWYELIPLFSFFWQKGRCRSCKEKLAWQYPLVELFCGLVFVLIPWSIKEFFIFSGKYFLLNWLLASAFWLVVFWCLMAALIIDWRHMIIPNSINLTLFFLGVLWLLLGHAIGFFDSVFGGSFLKQFSLLFPLFHSTFLNHFFGALIFSFIFALLVFFSKERLMGMGDVKLIGALGLLFGWPDILILVLLAFLIGGLAAAFLILLEDKKMKDQIPFGPFLIVAALIVFLVGAGLLQLYFGIIMEV